MESVDKAPLEERGTSEAKTTQQLDNALRALNHKKPVPEIDFTLHTMEDGNQVSTMERVCKGAYQIRINKAVWDGIQ